MKNIIFDSRYFNISTEYRTKFNQQINSQRFASSRDKLLRGEKINTSENKAAWHSALRTPSDTPSPLVDAQTQQQIQNSLKKMHRLITQLHAQTWLGASGSVITDVVYLGIGGSYLGPKMACFALEEFRCEQAQNISIHFAASMDGTALQRLINRLNPATTLFIIASKSFSTLDTMLNAKSAKTWLEHTLNASTDTILAKHFIGCSANQQAMNDWGIHEDNQLLLWDWVGGRYSIWSVIGLPLALQIGMQHFRDFLAGAHATDQHFLSTAFDQNIPIQMALCSTFAIETGCTANAILPYDDRLRELSSYLQQLIMESNGKSVSHTGEAIHHRTSPIIFGSTGSYAQHSFFQLLHQGTQKVFCDFILFKQPPNNQNTSTALSNKHHQCTIDNAIAQMALLSQGNSLKEQFNIPAKKIPPGQKYPGRTNTCALIIDELNPYSLGQLLALYEQRTFVEAFIWGINPFDQWGVELGKQIANKLQHAENQPTGVTDIDQLRAHFLSPLD